MDAYSKSHGKAELTNEHTVLSYTVHLYCTSIHSDLAVRLNCTSQSESWTSYPTIPALLYFGARRWMIGGGLC